MRRGFPILLFAVLLALIVSVFADNAVPPRERLKLDEGWKFFLGDPSGAEKAGFNDSNWREVELPHDWSIEGDFDEKAPMGGAGGFLPAGVGWYRHEFAVPLTWKGRDVWVEFEGIYMNAEVWVNGKKVAEQPYGYTSFVADLTKHLKPGEKNVLAVRVDNSKQKNSRWYAGSGIYRHVWMAVADAVHVVPSGVFAQTTEATEGKARLGVETEVVNSGDQTAQVAVRTTLLDKAGKVVGQSVAQKTLEAGEKGSFAGEIEASAPELWSPERPAMYSVVTQVERGGKVVDGVKTPFGIRTLAWTVDKGFQLNGKTIKLYGGCVHHDHGPLGAAAYDRAEERRVELLLAMGFNAVRTSHNPPSAKFLDACDRLGLMVMDEAFDCWSEGKNSQDYHVYFKDWWRKDLEALVKRDRNHPSIVMWSIGNEIPERYKETGAEEARELADFVRKLDPTRPVTEGILFRPKPEEMAIFDKHCEALDIAGYNYAIHAHGEDHARVPSRVMVSTESNPRDAFSSWAIVNDNAYVVGDFMWSAIDYLGEAGIGRAVLDGDAEGHGEDRMWPWRSAYCGDMDLIGTRKPVSFYRNIVWDRGEKLYMAVQTPAPEGSKWKIGGWALTPTAASWTWPGFEGRTVKVEVYSRGDEVKLYQDGKQVGEAKTGREQQFKATFDVKYQPGVLRAEAYREGKEIGTVELKTAGEAAKVRLVADREAMSADDEDLIFVIAEVVDAEGNVRPDAANDVEFSIEGPAVIAGVGNGDAKDLGRFQAEKCKAFEGRAQVVLRATGKPGGIKLRVSTPQLGESVLALESRKVGGALR